MVSNLSVRTSKVRTPYAHSVGLDQVSVGGKCRLLQKIKPFISFWDVNNLIISFPPYFTSLVLPTVLNILISLRTRKDIGTYRPVYNSTGGSRRIGVIIPNTHQHIKLGKV